jgi:maltooligosyltrehalose trehalohydrolase
MHQTPRMSYPQCHKDGCRFRVWAPDRAEVFLELEPAEPIPRPKHSAAAPHPDHARSISHPANRAIPMQRDPHGYFFADIPDAGSGTRYRYRIDKTAYPDPASAYQPQGVYGPSEVVDHRAYRWHDASWHVPPFAELIFYELHVGTFTAEGTFDAIIPRLADLAALGINALELMPVAACSGERNWGYDGAFLYAVQQTYGGPEALKRLVDAAHTHGIAVFLDVVYNHIGREGNCLEAFGPYFTDQYHTPWGKAINYDGAWSDAVRAFITDNAIYWAEQFHFDGLRLDAIHEIYDRNAITIWDDLHTAISTYEQRSGRRCYLVAESDTNDPRVVQPPESGGRGFDAQWMDDFHHCLYVLLHPQGGKHYQDFGGIEQLARAYTQGFVHTGEYLRFRHRRHGASSAGISGEHFIVFNQNHDLPGNRPGGERLSTLVDQDTLKLAAAVLLLSPYIPFLFMGEEYGEDAPFFFFSDYQDPATTKGLLDGRRDQFAAFNFAGEVRDPQDETLFQQSKLTWEKRSSGNHRLLLEWYRELIRLRRTHPLFADLSKQRLQADVVGAHGLSVYRYSIDGDRHLVCLYNFSHDTPLSFTLGYALAQGGTWRRLIASGAASSGSYNSRSDALNDAARMPETITAGASIQLPAQGVAVYELNARPTGVLNPSPGSPAPAA